jgi:hypothetical protein
MYQTLLEYTYSQFRNKQKSAPTLHRKYPERVKAVQDNGGARLYDITPDYWQFKVSSGTKKAVRYDVYLKFKDLPDMIRKYGRNTRIWKKDGSGINASLLADVIYAHVDLETRCSCESDLYSGFQYIRTQRDANYGDPENRAPVKRNPKELGIVCKHTAVVLNRLPFYSRNTLANYLLEFYSDDITATENDVKNVKAQKAYDKKFKSEPRGL